MTPSDLLALVPHFDPGIANEYLSNLRMACEERMDLEGKRAGGEDYQKKISEAMQWEVRALAGFSPGEIGPLLQEFEGGYYPHDGGPIDILRRKLGLSDPRSASSDLLRSRALRPFALRAFTKANTHHGLERDEAAPAKVKEYVMAGGDPDHPWLSGSPRDIFRTSSGETWLVSFKFPRAHATALNLYHHPADHAKAGLAHGKLLLNRAGIQVDRCVVCPLSLETMDIYPALVEITGDMENRVLLAGDHYWSLVQNQELPKFQSRNRLENIEPDQLPPDLGKKLYSFAYLKKVESAVTRRLANHKERTIEMLKEAGVDCGSGSGSVRVPFVNIKSTARRVFDQTAALDMISKLGGDPGDPALYRITSSPTAELIRGNKHAYAEEMQEIADLAERLVDEGFDDLESIADLADFTGELSVSDTRDLPADPLFAKNGASSSAPAADTIEPTL